MVNPFDAGLFLFLKRFTLFNKLSKLRFRDVRIFNQNELLQLQLKTTDRIRL